MEKFENLKSIMSNDAENMHKTTKKNYCMCYLSVTTAWGNVLDIKNVKLNMNNQIQWIRILHQ